jgi:hypothetical protein
MLRELIERLTLVFHGGRGEAHGLRERCGPVCLTGTGYVAVAQGPPLL